MIVVVVTDLHDLFDVLDPKCTGSVSLQEFSKLLRAYRQVEGGEQDTLRNVLGSGTGWNQQIVLYKCFSLY